MNRSGGMISGMSHAGQGTGSPPNRKCTQQRYRLWAYLFSVCVSLMIATFLTPALAQAESGGADTINDSVTAVDLTEGPISTRIIQLFLALTVLSLAPGIAMMVTCLPFLVIVFSFLRQAIGLQQSPPNMLIMSLAIFLTFFIMEPVFKEAWKSGIKPLIEEEITESQAFTRTMVPFEEFMLARAEKEAMARLADALPDRTYNEDEKPALSLLIPAFMLSEIKHAFQIGFVIFLPFLIIDLVVASVLMALGMMMVPPIVVSLPFKLAFFVMADGWIKITEALLRGYTG